MIVCPVCGGQNHHLAIVCKSCGSFIQSKVDTIDLFSTMWRLIESPNAAFRRIAIASHKNYVVFLGCITGIGCAFALMWMLKVGDSDLSLFNILAAGVLSGPVIGICSLVLLAALQKTAAVVFRLPARFRNVLAITAYSTIPIVFSVVFLLPIEILTFGKFMFSTNPSPAVLKPVSYFLLLGLDSLCLLWSVTLYVLGVRVLYDVRVPKAFLLSCFSLITFGALLAAGILTLATHHKQSGRDTFFTAGQVLTNDALWKK